MTHEEDIKRLNEKIEFLSRTNMLYSDWEHRETQVTSELIRKGIEASKVNAELRVEIERIKDAVLAEREACAALCEWVGLTDQEIREEWFMGSDYDDFARAIEAKLKDKNHG